MSKDILDEIILEQLQPMLKGLLGVDAELLSEGDGDLASVDPEKLLKSIQALKISQENWGKSVNEDITSKDREIFRMHAERIPGNSVEEKLRGLGAFMEQNEEARTSWGMSENSLENLANIGQLISNVVLIKTISKILNQFEAETSGYIMESFFAALGGGERRGGKGTIVDFEIDGKYYSSKILSPSKGFIAGSFEHLKKALKDGKKITFFVGLKRTIGDQVSLQFYSQEVTKDNFFDWMTDGRAMNDPKGARFKYIAKISEPEKEEPEKEEHPLQKYLLNVMYSMDSAYKKLKGKGALEGVSFESLPIRTFLLYVLISFNKDEFTNLHGILEGKMKDLLKADPALKNQLKKILEDKELKDNVNERFFDYFPEKSFVLSGVKDPPKSMKQVKELARGINEFFKQKKGIEDLSLNDLFSKDGRGASFNKTAFSFLPELYKIFGENLDVKFKTEKGRKVKKFAESLAEDLDEKDLEYLTLILASFYTVSNKTIFNVIYRSFYANYITKSTKEKKRTPPPTSFLPQLEEASKSPAPPIENATDGETSIDKVLGIPIDKPLEQTQLKNFIETAKKMKRLDDLLSGLQFKGDLAKINLEKMTMVASINIGEDYLFRTVQEALKVKKEVLRENIKLIQELQTQLSNITVNLNKFYEDFGTQSASDAKGSADNISKTLAEVIPSNTSAKQ